MRVGVPQVEAREWDENAAVERLLSGRSGVRSAFLGYCRDCCRCCGRCCRSGGGRCLLWRLGRSLWSRRTSARRYEQRNERNSQ